MTSGATLVGAAVRYIGGRNAVQTVYWRSSSNNTQHKFMKTSRTVVFDKSETCSVPQKLREEQNIRF